MLLLTVLGHLLMISGQLLVISGQDLHDVVSGNKVASIRPMPGLHSIESKGRIRKQLRKSKSDRLRKCSKHDYQMHLASHSDGQVASEELTQEAEAPVEDEDKFYAPRMPPTAPVSAQVLAETEGDSQTSHVQTTAGNNLCFISSNAPQEHGDDGVQLITKPCADDTNIKAIIFAVQDWRSPDFPDPLPGAGRFQRKNFVMGKISQGGKPNQGSENCEGEKPFEGETGCKSCRCGVKCSCGVVGLAVYTDGLEVDEWNATKHVKKMTTTKKGTVAAKFKIDKKEIIAASTHSKDTKRGKVKQAECPETEEYDVEDPDKLGRNDKKRVEYIETGQKLISGLGDVAQIIWGGDFNAPPHNESGCFMWPDYTDNDSFTKEMQKNLDIIAAYKEKSGGPVEMPTFSEKVETPLGLTQLVLNDGNCPTFKHKTKGKYKCGGMTYDDARPPQWTDRIFIKPKSSEVMERVNFTTDHDAVFTRLVLSR